MKLKKRYKKFKYTSIHYLAALRKLDILDNMSTSIQDVVHNSQYIWVHYPLDDDIRNTC